MMAWAKLLSLFSAVTTDQRAPDEIKLDHSLNNYHTVMLGAAAKAKAITDRLEKDPKRVELKRLKERSISTIEALVRDQQGKR